MDIYFFNRERIKNNAVTFLSIGFGRRSVSDVLPWRRIWKKSRIKCWASSPNWVSLPAVSSYSHSFSLLWLNPVDAFSIFSCCQFSSYLFIFLNKITDCTRLFFSALFNPLPQATWVSTLSVTLGCYLGEFWWCLGSFLAFSAEKEKNCFQDETRNLQSELHKLKTSL